MSKTTWILAALLLGSCSSGTPSTEPSPTGDPELWRTDLSEPYAFTTPVPPLRETPLDGLYSRNYEEGSEPIPCRRCAPFRLDRGEATLEMTEGRYRIEHAAASFRTVGHYLADDSKLTLFNDPNCPRTRGTYRWELSGGRLTLEVIDDPCPFDLLRARYLTAAPWES